EHSLSWLRKPRFASHSCQDRLSPAEGFRAQPLRDAGWTLDTGHWQRDLRARRWGKRKRLRVGRGPGARGRRKGLWSSGVPMLGYDTNIQSAKRLARWRAVR